MGQEAGGGEEGEELRAAAVVLLLAVALHAQGAKRFRVEVEVSNDKEPLKGMLTSYVGRELRALGDVEVVYDSPDVILTVSGTGLSNIVSISFVATMPLKDWGTRVSDPLTRQMLSHTDAFLGAENDSVLVPSVEAAPRVIEEGCNKLVTSFDGWLIEEFRKAGFFSSAK